MPPCRASGGRPWRPTSPTIPRRPTPPRPSCNWPSIGRCSAKSTPPGNSTAKWLPISPTRRKRKAGGGLLRLDCVGKPLSFHGRSTTGENIDLSAYRGKVVLLHYWATFSPPCKVDIAVLKDLMAKYGHAGFAIISVSLDSRLQDITAYLAGNKLDWPQIFEEGGLDSRPANALGILTVPTMILVDQSGKVVSRSIKITELEGELKKLLH